MKFGFEWPSGFTISEEMLDEQMTIYMDFAPGQRQTTPWGQIIFTNIKILSIFRFSTSFRNLMPFYQFSPFQCIGNLSCKIGQGHPRVMIYIIFVKFESWDNGATCQASKSYAFWFWRRRFLKILAINSPGGHLGLVAWTIYINIHSPFARRLLMKFGFDWPSGFNGDV